MKNILKKLLSVFLILLNTINISAITFEELNKEQQMAFKNLIECAHNNNIKDFIEILATKTNFELTNINEQNLIEIIGLDQYKKIIPTKESFVYALFLYSMLSEVIQQTNEGTNIKRFYKIRNTLEVYLTSDLPILPIILKKILSSKFNTRTEEFQQTSFYWYLYEKIIRPNKIMNPCLQKSLIWFLNRLRIAILNYNLEEIQSNLEKVPFLLALKISNLSLVNFTKEHLPKEKSKEIIKIIENTKEKFSAREPSGLTALFRYSWF